MVAMLGTAHADPSERADRNRVYQAAPFAAGGAFYLLLEFGLKDAITPDHCRWCRSNALDTAARSALKWDDVHRADQVSNVTGYFAAPSLAIGSLMLSSAGEHDGRRWFDDSIPVLQAGIVGGVANQGFKLIFVRRRPYSEFKAKSVRKANDSNTSFFSGHTGLAFAMASSSGMVASLRDYRSAPAIWAGGMVLAVGTGYLRVASDAHYLTDVIAGAVAGTAIGLAIPLLFHREVLTDEAPVARTKRHASRGTVMLSFGSRF